MASLLLRRALLLHGLNPHTLGLVDGIISLANLFLGILDASLGVSVVMHYFHQSGGDVVHLIVRNRQRPDLIPQVDWEFVLPASEVFGTSPSIEFRDRPYGVRRLGASRRAVGTRSIRGVLNCRESDACQYSAQRQHGGCSAHDPPALLGNENSPG